MEEIDYRKVSLNPEVIKLIKEREEIERKIIAIDKGALIRFKLEKLNQ